MKTIGKMRGADGLLRAYTNSGTTDHYLVEVKIRFYLSFLYFLIRVIFFIRSFPFPCPLFHFHRRFQGLERVAQAGDGGFAH
jgi:hypothetical protein